MEGGAYHYPPVECKIFDNNNLMKIDQFSGKYRSVCKSVKFNKGVYYAFVLVKYDTKLETNYDVTLALYG